MKKPFSVAIVSGLSLLFLAHGAHASVNLVGPEGEVALFDSADGKLVRVQNCQRHHVVNSLADCVPEEGTAERWLSVSDFHSALEQGLLIGLAYGGSDNYMLLETIRNGRGQGLSQDEYEKLSRHKAELDKRIQEILDFITKYGPTSADQTSLTKALFERDQLAVKLSPGDAYDEAKKQLSEKIDAVVAKVTSDRLNTIVIGDKSVEFDFNALYALSRAPGLGLSFAKIPAGSFTRKLTYQPMLRFEEKIVQNITLSHDFEMQTTDMTELDWFMLTGKAPPHHAWPDRKPYLTAICGTNTVTLSNIELCPLQPLRFATWDEAQDAIDALNVASDDYVYRLPTYAEWTYVRKLPENAKLEDYVGKTVSYAEPSPNYTIYYFGYGAEVASKKAFNYGLYDLIGNAAQWLQDFAFKRPLPSGNYIDPKGPSRGSAHMAAQGAGNWPNDARAAGVSGFRLVREPKAKK
jgi:formylglycine-generating enzyme required for sulfatase activity